MSRCSCDGIRVDCVGWCGCICWHDQTPPRCYVICDGTIFGPLNRIAAKAEMDLHTHGPVPLVDIVRLLNKAVDGGINVSVPSSRLDEKVRLKMKAKLPQILKKLRLKADS